MSELVLPAELFSDEPVLRKIIYPNGYELEVLVMPVTGEIDVEYQKLKGHDLQEIKFTPASEEEGPGGKPHLEPIGRVFSNEREVKANRWLAKKIIKGFPNGIKLDDGTMLDDPMKHLNALACIAWFIQPIFKDAYRIGDLKTEAEEGN